LWAGASPNTPLGELTALPQTPQLGSKGPTSKATGREGEGKRREGKGWREEKDRGERKEAVRPLP